MRVGELLSVDQHDALRDPGDEVVSGAGKVRCRDQHALGRPMAFEAADEIAHFAQRDALVGIEALGLHIDDVEAELVLLDDAVDPAVADPAERPAHLDPSAAVAHPHQKVDDEALEESRAERMHPADDVAGELGVEQFETRGDRFPPLRPAIRSPRRPRRPCSAIARRRTPDSARAFRGRSRSPPRRAASRPRSVARQ